MSPVLALSAAVIAVAVVALLRWREPVFAAAGRSAVYLHNVRAEVRKVTWPTVDQLRQSTVVIIIFVIIIGIVIGIMDWMFSKLLIDFLGRALG